MKVSDSRAVRVRGQVVDGTTGQAARFGASVTLVPRRGTVATASARLNVTVSANVTTIRWLSNIEQSETEGPVVITRNGKAVAVLVSPVDEAARLCVQRNRAIFVAL
jgi:hypothetical protein